MRRVLAVLAATVLVVLSASPVMAGGKPEKIPDVLADPQVFPAGDVCDFDLQMVIDLDKGKAIVFPPAADGSQRVLVSGHIVATVTNLGNGHHATYNISGPGTFTYGDTLKVDASGTWLFFNFPGGPVGPGMWLSTGKSLLEIDLADGHWLSFSPARNTLDVCASLGGAHA